MHSAKKPWWQQATALVTVTTGGMITGFNFVPGAAEAMTSPTSVPLHLLALEQAGRPGAAMNARAIGGDSADAATGNALLRSAIVNVAKYYLQLAATRTPAQLEALIWDNTSLNGADHGPSCAAFASLTLELAAQAVGQQSWVSGGTSYPWPLPAWADVRVDPNPASPDITSMVTDAQGHGRWQPLGDGYQPQPGDWVLFEHHVEVVTSYSDGVLDSIGADSAPNLSVNAHSITGSLAAAGVQGFIDNGNLATACDQPGAAAPGGCSPARRVQAAMVPGVVAAGPRSDDRAALPPALAAARPDGRTRGGDPWCRARDPRRGGRQCHPRSEPGRDPPRRPRCRRPPRRRRPACRKARAVPAVRRARAGDAGDAGPAGVHQPDRAGGGGSTAAVGGARGGDHRAGDRRVRLGEQPARRQVPQPLRHQGGRACGQRRPADLRVLQRPVGEHTRAVPRLSQRRRVHRGPRGAARHQRLLPAGDGGPRGP